MDDLVRWLGEQLDEDERIARAAIDAEFVTSGRWCARGPYGDDDRYGNIQSELNEQIIEEDLLWQHAVHIAEHDPARVLQEIDAKRDLLAFAKGIHDHHATFTTGVYARLEKTLRLYALAYKDRPGYRPEWAPTP